MAKKKDVIDEEVKQNPSDVMAAEDAKKKKKEGKWIPATYEQLVAHEKAGRLVGHDPETGHVLLKEE